MLVIFLYMEFLLFSNQKVPCWTCKGTKPTSYKNAQHQNQLRCWSTKAPALFVFIKRFLVLCLCLYNRECLLSPVFSHTRFLPLLNANLKSSVLVWPLCSINIVLVILYDFKEAHLKIDGVEMRVVVQSSINWTNRRLKKSYLWTSYRCCYYGLVGWEGRGRMILAKFGQPCLLVPTILTRP